MNENFSGSIIFDDALKELLENAPVGILFFDETGRINFINRNFSSLGLLHLDEYENSDHNLISKFSLVNLFNLHREIEGIQNSKSFQRELSKIENVTGNEISLVIKGSPIYINGKYKGGILILEDIKDISAGKKKDIDTDQLVSKALDDISDYYLILDENKNIINSSCKESNIFSGNENQILTSIVFERFFDSCKFSKTKGRADLPIEIENNILLIRTLIIPVDNAEENLSKYIVLFTDMTSELNEKIRNEGELNELRRYKLINNSVGNAVVTVNEENKITYWNRKAEELYGYDKSRIYGKLIDRIILDLNDEFISELRKELKKKDIVEKQLSIRSNGSQQKYLYLKSSLLEEGTLVFQFADITYLLSNTSRFIGESEERYKNIIENLHEVLWTAENINGRLKAIFYTASTELITGFHPQQFIDDPKLWYKIIFPDDLKRVIKELKDLYRDKDKEYGVLEYRILHKKGNIIWIRNKITVIRNENGQIQKIYGLVNDISESKKSEENLKKYGEELKELNKAKDRFISIVSHDLRSPFNSILGFTDLLLNEPDVTEDEKNQYIKYIRESSFNLLSLVNSLLDWTRLQTGRIDFEPERIDARLIITRAIHMLSGAAMKKDIDLRSGLQNSLYIKADENLILQAFNNLVSNAIKFTKPGGRILISAEIPDQKNYVQFSVKDNGVGIDQKNIDKLFKVDTKFTLVGTAGEKGSGLGLSLVQEIVQKHGGTIWVESRVEKGSNFIFTIPMAPANILFVDDATSDRILYSKLIKNLLPDYNILKAQTAQEALKILETSKPALIISDHKMPEMNGYDLIKKINESGIKNKPPFIILSNYLNDEIAQSYKDAGVEYVFRKPVNLSKFKFALETELKKSYVNQEHSQE